MTVRPIPEGYGTVTPYLIVPDAAAQIDFMRKAFGAVETGRFTTPEGRIMHASMTLGDSPVMLGEATEEWKPMPCVLHLYLEDTDAAYATAIAAGARSLREPADQFYGDRAAGVVDDAGNQWWIATHVEDVPREEMEQRMKQEPGDGS
jgi:PhnB protein